MRKVVIILMILPLLVGCSSPNTDTQTTAADIAPSQQALQLVVAAESQTGKTFYYDASYVEIDYPGGDVPIERGVCTDVIVRAFRGLGVDLQVEVHEDMAAHFEEYPQNWDLDAPNSNIDHRRVPNLQTYFAHAGAEIDITDNPNDYWPGDVVSWSVEGRPHIGIVSTQVAPGGERFCIVHNFGAGVKTEDALFLYPITGHYRPI